MRIHFQPVGRRGVPSAFSGPLDISVVSASFSTPFSISITGVLETVCVTDEDMDSGCAWRFSSKLAVDGVGPSIVMGKVVAINSGESRRFESYNGQVDDFQVQT